MEKIQRLQKAKFYLEMLACSIEQKLTISEIARLHNRNNGGIRARLKKFGLVD